MIRYRKTLNIGESEPDDPAGLILDVMSDSLTARPNAICPVWRLVGISSLALVALQLCLWLTIGIWSLPYSVRGMVERDFYDCQASFQESGVPLPVNDERQYYILCERFSKKLGPQALAELNELYSHMKVELVTESQAAEIPEIADGPSPNVDELCYFVDLNTPLIAHVEYGKRDCPLCSWGVGHRAWFVLGIWVPSGVMSSWVS